MGKGSKPRNCFSTEFRDNYDTIDWGDTSKQREMVNDCPTPYRWGNEGYSTIEGMIRQTCDLPLSGDDCIDENNCCANEKN